MWLSDKWQDFELLDCSKGEKLERWGRYYLVRPDPQAIWDTPRRNKHWNDRDARYRRSETAAAGTRAACLQTGRYITVSYLQRKAHEL